MYTKYLINILKISFYLIFLEFFFLVILGILFTSNILLDLEIRHKIHFSKNDLPHPIFVDYSFTIIEDYITFDPNTLWYLYKYRWGEERKINKKEDNQKFIYITGGSTVEGDGSPTESDSLPYKINQELRENGCLNVKVFNEGISGFSIKQEFITISTKLLRFQKPDLIISFNGVNDFLSYTGNRTKQDNLYDIDWNTKSMYFADEFYSNNFLTSYIFSVLKKTITGRAAMTFYDLFTDQPLVLTLAKVNFEKTLDPNISYERFSFYSNLSKMVSENSGVDYVHIIQPTLFFKKKLHENEKIYMSNNYNLNAPEVSFTDLFWKNFTEFYKLIVQTNNTINASELFKNSDDHDFIDHVHYTPLANTKIAKYISKIILEDYPSIC